MKQETRVEKINHPDLGELTKMYTYTYDETKYKSLDECIADHETVKKEVDELSDKLTKENEAKTLKAKNDYELALAEWAKLKPVHIAPELKWLDNKPFEGRGYVSKTIETKDAPTDLKKILSNATPEEIEFIKNILK